jgi:hypothetical protein
MRLHLLTIPLLTSSLLLSTLSCSKKDDATPLDTGSYKLDGKLKNCKAETDERSFTIGSRDYKALTVYLTTTPQPATGAEVLKLTFVKYASLADTTYRCDGMALFTHGEQISSSQFYAPTYSKSPLTLTSSNRVSGVFAGSVTNSSPSYAYKFISEGVFTNVHL